MKTSLVVGMGIGNLYNTVLNHLGHGVVTVDSDPNKVADFLSVDAAIVVCRMFDTVHICTPNFTHLELARKLAPVSKIVFIEKPGVATADEWRQLCKDYPKTRFMMVKNNMWRSNIPELVASASIAKTVNISWIRKNCIPHPGSWFTTRELAYGGVSRDLMPHLLSLYIAMNPGWETESVNGKGAQMLWELKDINGTDYGVVNPNGTYDVDDQCHIDFGSKWHTTASWRSMDIEDSSIQFIFQDNSALRFELGWCPEEAYHNMIIDAIANIDNTEFWNTQLKQDLWIHKQLEVL
jgi:predicted dehydrogenase